MKKKKALDLTSGPILKTLAGLALPIMASSFLATAYNLTDMAWIGMLGSKAVAGIGVGGMYVWLSQGLVALARMGGQVNVAQCCGSGEKQRAQHYSGAAIWLTIVFGVIFTAICLTFTDPLIAIFNVGDPETLTAAKVYMRITCGLTLFPFLTLTLTGLYTAQGDSRTPFFANLAGLVVNMILDPLIILGIGPFPRLEAAGAAIATTTAQFLVLVVLVAGVFRSGEDANILKGMRLFARIPSEYFKSICRIGIPTALQSMAYCAISMVLTRFVSDFGPGAIATFRVGGQIESVSWNTADGFGAALNAFVGQNYGAKKSERIREGYHISLKLLVVWGLVITVAFVFFPKPIANLFFHETDVIEIATEYLMIIGFSELLMCVELMTVGALSGLGMTKLCSTISISLTGSRIPLAIVLVHMGMGLAGVWWAMTLTSMAKGIIFYLTFRRISNKLD
ncbi:MATE family efflux transporter [Roseburia hominis]